MSILGGVFGQATGGNAGDVLGQEGLGLTGTKQSGSSQVSLDPTTQALNSYRLGGIQGIQDTGISAYNNLGGYYNTNQSTNDLINQLITQASIPGVQPNDWYNQAIGGTDISNQANMFKDANNPSNLYNAANMAGSLDYTALQKNLQGIQDVQPQLLGAGNDFFHQILGPQIQNQ